MNSSNYIGLTEAELDQPIYRIFSLERFFQVLDKKQLALVKPHLWDDPFENVLLKSQFKTASNETAIFEAHDSVYGQCWTRHAETDAMWRIYSQHKNGVRLKTTPRKLLATLQANIHEHPELCGFIGKVAYAANENQLKEQLQQINLTATDGTGIAQSLLYKRKEFEHEQEIRLIYSGPDGKCPNNIFNCSIKPNTLFDSIMFDPRIDESLRKACTAAIQNLGCNVKVEISNLYDLPNGFSFHLN